MLELAGVVKRVPMFIWWADPIWSEPDEYGAMTRIGTNVQEMVTFEPVAPIWAWKLAKRLSEDQDAIRAVGKYRTEKREAFGGMARKLQLPVVGNGKSRHAQKLVLPVEERAAIVRTAASNAMAREMIDDSWETAIKILRDVS